MQEKNPKKDENGPWAAGPWKSIPAKGGLVSKRATIWFSNWPKAHCQIRSQHQTTTRSMNKGENQHLPREYDWLMHVQPQS